MRRGLRRVLVAHSSDEMYGADFILLRVLTALRQRGVTVKVLLPNDATGPRPLSGALLSVGCDVEHHALGVLRRRYLAPTRFVRLAWDWLLEVIRLCRVVREWKPDVIYSNTLAVTAPAVAARLTNTPHVWHVHEIVKEPAWLSKVLACSAAALSFRVIAVSSAVDHSLRQSAPSIPSRVIHNGIPDPMRDVRADNARKRANELLGTDDSTPLVLMIGRMSGWKGALEFLRVAEEHIRSGGNAHFLLVGGAVPGETRILDEVRSATRRPENRCALHWLDFTSDITPFLARASVFVLPSVLPDPFPTVVLEAMFAGLPVVAFHHGGVIEMLGADGAGCTVPVGNLDALREAIDRLLSNPAAARAMGARARARASAEFASEIFESRLHDELSNAANRQ